MQQLKNHPRLSFAGGFSRSKVLGSDGSIVDVSGQSKKLIIEKMSGLIDFSLPDAAQDLIDMATAVNDKCFLICTTGLTENQLNAWSKLAKDQSHKILIAPNTSLGISIFRKILDQFADKIKSLGFDVEILETHHRNNCLLYTSPSPRDKRQSRMPSSA